MLAAVSVAPFEKVISTAPSPTAVSVAKFADMPVNVPFIPFESAIRVTPATCTVCPEVSRSASSALAVITAPPGRLMVSSPWSGG